MRTLPIIVSDRSPSVPAHVVDDFTPPLISTGEHHLCPGCGEPAAMRSAVEMIDELGLTQRAMATFCRALAISERLSCWWTAGLHPWKQSRSQR